ncbi:MAG TPA: DUF6152 family protein [Steroidobacteraceae bacterium]|jgi:hypothetical protein
MKMFTKPLAALLGVATLCGALPASAHHSFAIYDRTKTLTLVGEVKSFQWTNPHCVIWFTVKPAGGGEAQDWGVETTSPGVLTRSGWTRNSIKAGDKVSVVFNPLRDGSHGGGLNSVTLLATGQVLVANFAAPDKGK